MPEAGPPAPPPGYTGARPAPAPAVPLNGDEAFLYGGPTENPSSPLARPGAKIPPPPEAKALLAILGQAAAGPGASPELKQLVALLAHHASS
jgi:hypothetical protein